MAEALWESLGQGKWESESAGSKPSGYVHPLAIRAMQEVNLDISSHQSKSVQLFKDQSFDLVVTVCDNAKDSCPVFTGAKQTFHWPFDDPADATGTDDEKMIFFRRVREEIQTKISTYLQSIA
jgi:arsenate reductase